MFNDRLLLGLKGTMSEAELHLLAGRLQGARRAAAERGELRFPLPVGYVYDDEGRIVMDPDEEVRAILAAIRLGLSNARLEGLNSKIRLISHRSLRPALRRRPDRPGLPLLHRHHHRAAAMNFTHKPTGALVVEPNPTRSSPTASSSRTMKVTS